MVTQGNYIRNKRPDSFKRNIKFCNYEGIELKKYPVKDHRATGIVERTISSINSYDRRYLREDRNKKFERVIASALSALRFVPHFKTKITPLEAHLGRGLATYSKISRENLRGKISTVRI